MSTDQIIEHARNLERENKALRAELTASNALMAELAGALQEVWKELEFGYITDETGPIECGQCGAKKSKVSNQFIHEADCYQGMLERNLTAYNLHIAGKGKE